MMKLAQVKEILKARTLGQFEDPEQHFLFGFGADLMSDVLAFISEGCLLLTGLATEQVIRTAEIVDVKAIIFVRGKNPPPNIIKLANEKNITLLSTDCTMYLACGMLYSGGLPGYVVSRDKNSGDFKVHGGGSI